MIGQPYKKGDWVLILRSAMATDEDGYERVVKKGARAIVAQTTDDLVYVTTHCGVSLIYGFDDIGEIRLCQARPRPPVFTDAQARDFTAEVQRILHRWGLDPIDHVFSIVDSAKRFGIGFENGWREADHHPLLLFSENEQMLDFEEYQGEEEEEEYE